MREKRLKHLFVSVIGGAWGSESGDSLIDLKCIRGADFDFTRFRVNASQAPTRGFTHEDVRLRAARDGDLIIEKSGGGDHQPVGRAVLWDGADLVMPTNFAARLRVNQETDPRFAMYLLASLWANGRTRASIKQTTGIQNLDLGALLNQRIRCPSLHIQRLVADYLDREIGRLDVLISAKEEMIDLLEQRRIAEAHATVTGVHINGARQASGTPWLGDIPSRWKMVRLGSMFDVQLGRMLSSQRSAGPHLKPYIRNINVRWGAVDTSDLAEMNFPPGDRLRYSLRVGDLLVNEGGAGIGRAAIWQGKIDEIYYQKSVHRIRPKSYLSVRWLLEWLRVAVDRKVFHVEGNLATIPHVPADALRQYHVPCPPDGDAEHLMANLDADVDRDIVVRDAALAQIQLLQERRQALITAAVTGQLDIPEAA